LGSWGCSWFASAWGEFTAWGVDVALGVVLLSERIGQALVWDLGVSLDIEEVLRERAYGKEFGYGFMDELRVHPCRYICFGIIVLDIYLR
jgi:hypothetical protein